MSIMSEYLHPTFFRGIFWPDMISREARCSDWFWSEGQKLTSPRSHPWRRPLQHCGTTGHSLVVVKGTLGVVLTEVDTLLQCGNIVSLRYNIPRAVCVIR